MAERTLEQRYRLLLAAFRQDAASSALREHLRSDFDPAAELVAHVLSQDLAIAPQEIDTEQLSTLMRSLLPGRIAGDERYRSDLPDVLDGFLQFIAREETLPSAWNWSTAIDGLRRDYEAALRNPNRPTSAAAVKHTPDRRPAPKIGRNDPCFCGSGKKYKQCCMKLLP